MVGGFPLFTGMLVGLSVSAPVGPMGVLCINRTLASGLGAGLSTGAGAATIMAGYGTLLFLGFHKLALPITAAQHQLHAVGGVLMVGFGIRVLARRVAGLSGRPARARSLSQTYLSAAALNLTNPMLIILLTGAITSITDLEKSGAFIMGLTILGMIMGSMAWWFVLCGATAICRARLSHSLLRVINDLAAFVLIGLGGLAVAQVMSVP